MTQIQRDLTYQLTQCTFDRESIVPCGYHANRVNSTTFAIEGDVLKITGRHTAILTSHNDVVSLAKLFEGRKDPAGGWYLVKEQREWLRKCLVDIFSGSKRPQPQTLRILEAGVASFVHHYTYLRIIFDALQESRSNVRIALTVVDQCAFPLLQITALENELSKGLRSPKMINVGKSKISIERNFLAVVNPKTRNFGNIGTELWVKDLADEESVAQLGCYDIITEHFLTSVLDKRIRERETVQIRKTYSRIMKQGGYLLTANGIIKGSNMYSEFIKLHQENGLKLIDNATRAVWDPYGLDRTSIVSFLYGEKELPISLDNTLSMFKKKR